MPFENNFSHFAREYDALSLLYGAQPPLTQHFLDQQAAAIVAALERGKGRIRYQLPDQIILEGGESLNIPPAVRLRTVGKFLKRSSRLEKRAQLIQHLTALEQGMNPGLAVCANLFRFALARTIVNHLLPDGNPVRYQFENGDDIPSIPVEVAPPSALLAATDVVIQSETANSDDGRLQVPYVADARRFYLPQWVAFGEGGCLLIGSLAEAEVYVASLENAVRLLQDAVSICPSVVADEAYQRKRAGLLGQLINQGRALAHAYTQEIIAKIHSRTEAGTLNRGLRLSLPYFDDYALSLRILPIEIIPDGRIMFVPAFVVLAMRQAKEQIYNDYHLNPSTRRHLLAHLTSIEYAFKKRSSR